MQFFLRFFFHHLYHGFAWGYDFVAWVVSLGRWKEWCKAVLPMLPPGRILELGSGPGHLQHWLSAAGRTAVGLDESWQMVRQSSRRYPGSKFLRAHAETAPFSSAAFEVVTATFPAPYIFMRQTAAEMSRILSADGHIILLLAVRPTGLSLQARLIRALFKITGETPPASFDHSALFTAYREVGFAVTTGWVSLADADLLIMRGQKLGRL